MATTTSVADKALNIPELLEAILVELPPLDLIKLQRTNTTFKATIERSSKIRQKLFYKGRVGTNNGLVNINPFLALILRHHGFGGMMDIFTLDDEGFISCSVLWSVEKLLDRQKYRVLAHEKITLDLLCLQPQNFKPTSRGNSYNDMLIADSPIKVVAKFCCPGKRKVQVKTLGELLEACCLRHMRYSRFYQAEQRTTSCVEDD